MIFKRIQKFPIQKHSFKELVWPILGCICLLIVCVITSGQKLLWMDEILSYYPASISSFSKMIVFINDKVQCGHPFYFISLWLWAKAFSASEVSLRLFSSLGFCCALLVTWSMLRKIYDSWSATLSTLTVFLGASLILDQNSEARMYGLLLFLCALLSQQTIDLPIDPSFNKRKAIMQVLLNGLLPLTHPFGFVYSFMHIVAAVLIDLRRGVFRSWYYLSAFAGWFLYIPFIPAFLKQSELSKPHFWIWKPSLQDLTSLYVGDVHFNSIVFFLFAIIIFLFLKKRNSPRPGNDEAILILGAFYALIPLGVWMESQKFMSLFMPRYLIGVELGWAIFLSAIFARILPEREDLTLFRKIILSLAAVVIMILPINHAFELHRPPMPDAQLTNLYPTLPIVMDAPHIYLPLVYYSLDAKRYYFVLDWEVALYPDNALFATQDFQAMQALKHHIPGLNIVATSEFLNKYSSFIVLAGRKWFKYRIKNNPLSRVQDLGDSIYLVQKTQAAAK